VRAEQESGGIQVAEVNCEQGDNSRESRTCESAGQDYVRGHLADDARDRAVAFQAWIRFVAIGEQGGLRFTLAFTKASINGGIVGEAAAAGSRRCVRIGAHQCWKA